ncbi:MAG: PSD1 and planctomycete cytochrome C domain-containing protein [Akkermansiaceae bacterium]|nr:PSD1 and planctomycete cytochrome C domain-containing protein [Akkermansiaceae bacterium]
MVLKCSQTIVFASFLLINSVLGAEKIDFAREVLPILSDKCFTCHGPDTKKAKDLRLDSYEAATKDRKGIRSIDPDDLENSELIFRIHDEDDPMPPEDDGKPLTAEEKEILTLWVKQGGEYASHWAFVTPKKSKGAPREKVIDFFIERKLETNKPSISLAKEASQEILARRAALVVTGLPPQPALLKTFLADKSPDSYERFVDKLLASPRYGEHQARYWLDAIRYGDTHGLHLDNKRGIYPYRDWVVRAFNKNLPINDFITWQIAGDLLPNPTITQKIATGYVRMNPTTSEGGAIPDEFQAKNNFDRTETLGTVMLGMTMSCARCHTHKYDPITHKEYFSLLAFFNSTAENPLDGNKYDHGPAMKAPANPKEWEALASSDGKDQDTIKSFSTTTLIAQELPKPRVTKILERGEYHSPIGEGLTPDVPAAMGSFPKDAPRNRLGLAQWLTADTQPLVTRVLINRIWQRVFGYGLVRTPEDFGLQGEQATHPELLDWLAVEFREKGWNQKHILRLLVTSQAFKQSSQFRTDLDDPKNRLLARGPAFRLDAEVIRDIGLWSSGLLDPTMGGEGVKPYQPAGLWKALMHPASNTKNYVQDKGEKLYRRSLYVYWKRTSPHPMMTLFDAPNRESSCVKRSRSSTALQSLALLNETQRVEMARKLAERLIKSSPDDKSRLNHLYQILACRPSLPRESKACLDLLATMKKRYASSPEEANALLSTGEAPINSELNPAELAAWTQVATTVLATDVALSLF